MSTKRRERRDGSGAPDREARRLELLDAAIAVIRREGPGASMEVMAAEAGITKPILYRHFSDRAGLIIAVAERFAEGLTNELDQALLSGSGPRDALERTIDAYLAFVERDTNLYRFVVQGVSAGEPLAIGDFMDQIGRRIGIVIGELLRAAGQDSGGAEPIAHGIVGMVHAAGDWWVERRTMPRARVVGYLTDLLWAGLEPLARGGEDLDIAAAAAALPPIDPKIESRRPG